MAQLVGSNSLGLGKLIDGKNQFVHIMYSANADGSNMTADIQSNTKYIGIVTSNSETPPANPSDYSWGRFVGTSGTSSYTWLRYSPNEDGSNMTANPTSETKYIGVAITSDNNAPSDYTKYSWALIKGDDGRGISKTEVTYQKSTSGTVIPTGTWVTTIPTVNPGEYLWTRTLFTYTDNTTSSTYTVARSGVTGLGISRSDVDYQKSTSGTVAPTGSWTATIPTVAANEYLWTRTTLTYTNATTSVSYSVGKMGADGKDAQLLYLTASSQIQAFDKDDKPKTTQAITISAKLQNASGTATFVAIPYIGNVAQTPITLGGTGNDRTLLPSQWTNAQWTTIAITATLGSLTDTISVIRVKDGSTGPKGDQGNQGIQGPPGPDGKPTYIHWAYAWSADGKDRFTTTYPGENLVRNTRNFTDITGFATYTGTSSPTVENGIIKFSASNNGAARMMFGRVSNEGNTRGVSFVSGETFTVTMVFETTKLQSSYRIGGKYFLKNGTSPSEQGTGPNSIANIESLGDGLYRLTCKLTLETRANAENEVFTFYIYPTSDGSAETVTMGVHKFKIERGNVATLDTPSPKDDFANAYPTYAGTYTDNELIDSEDPTKYTWQRILGDEGESASSYWITPSVNVIKKSMTGLLSPTTITFSAFTKKGLEDSIPYSGRFVIFTSADGVIWTNRYTATTDSTSYTYTIPSNVNFVRARIYQAGATTALLDETNVPIIEDVNGLELGNRNYFSVKAWNTKPNLVSSGVPYMDVKVEPNTQYTLSTNIPDREGLYDVFFFKGTDVISSNSNGVAKGRPRTLTSDADGILKVGMRSYDLSNGYWIMLSQGNKALDWTPALEDAQLYTAWANSPDGKKDFTQFYPKENLLLNGRVFNTISNNNNTYPTTFEYLTENKQQFVRTKRSNPTSNPTTFSIYTAINIGSALATSLVGKKVGISVEARASSEVSMTLMARYVGGATGTFAGDGRTDTITTDWKQVKLVVDSYPTGATTIRFNPLAVTGTVPNLSTFYLDMRNWKIEILDPEQTEATPYTTPPSEDPLMAEMKYIGYSPVKTNNPSDYVWSENPKAQGTFRRWSNDPNGKIDFTDTYPNENELINSRSPKINAYQGTSVVITENVEVPEWGATDAVKHVISGGTNATVAGTLSAGGLVDRTVAYVHSIYVKNTGTAYVRFNNNLGKAIDVYPGETKRVVFPSSQNSTSDAARQFVVYRANATVTQEFIIWHAKIERSNDTATIWTPAPADGDLLSEIPQYVGIGPKDSMNPADFVWSVSPEYTQARTDLGLDTKVDDETFNDAQDHMNEVIDGKADSQELQDLKDMADNLQQSYEGFVGEGGQHEADLLALQARLEGVIFELGEQVAAFDFIKTHMRLGEEGFEIAEEGSTMKMLLTNETLSFIDGGKEVASFSNQKFIINQGAIVESLQVGSHKMSRLSDKVTVFQYAPKTTVTN